MRKPGTAGGLLGKEGAEGQDDMSRSYAVTAAKRSEQRRLANFIRLVDYMVQETLRDLLHGSMAGLLSTMAGLEHEASEYDRTKILYDVAVKAKDVRANASKRNLMGSAAGGAPGKKGSAPFSLSPHFLPCPHTSMTHCSLTSFPAHAFHTTTP